MKTRELAGDPQAMAIGERLFMNTARSATDRMPAAAGLPNPDRQGLAAWRAPRKISGDPAPGPCGHDAPMAAAVGSSDDVRNVAQYVLSLSNAPA